MALEREHRDCGAVTAEVEAAAEVEVEAAVEVAAAVEVEADLHNSHPVL
ncbi:MAG: hypothetical protein ACR2RV_24620 [Verrucomicrobiales bacterium]